MNLTDWKKPSWPAFPCFLQNWVTLFVGTYILFVCFYRTNKSTFFHETMYCVLPLPVIQQIFPSSKNFGDACHPFISLLGPTSYKYILASCTNIACESVWLNLIIWIKRIEVIIMMFLCENNMLMVTMMRFCWCWWWWWES